MFHDCSVICSYIVKVNIELEFDVKDLGEICEVLSAEVTCEENGVFSLGQEILQGDVDPGVKYTKSESKEKIEVPYRRTISKLLYLAGMTRLHL